MNTVNLKDLINRMNRLQKTGLLKEDNVVAADVQSMTVTYKLPFSVVFMSDLDFVEHILGAEKVRAMRSKARELLTKRTKIKVIMYLNEQYGILPSEAKLIVDDVISRSGPFATEYTK